MQFGIYGDRKMNLFIKLIGIVSTALIFTLANAADFENGEFSKLFLQESTAQFDDSFVSYMDNHSNDVVAMQADFDQQGNSRAQFELARAFQSGSKGIVDYHQAMILYHLSAENGYKPAQKYLALAYRDGLMGVEKNSSEARLWATVHAKNEDTFVRFSDYYVVENRNRK